MVHVLLCSILYSFSIAIILKGKWDGCCSLIIFLMSYKRVAEIQIFEKTYLIVIKDETDLKFKINDSTLFLIGLYVQKVVVSY